MSLTLKIFPLFLWTIASVSAGTEVLADEPSYCDSAKFIQHEITRRLEKPLLFRMHAFEFGQVTLIGLAVGLSSPKDIQRLALENSGGSANLSAKYCTWYFNWGNYEGMRDFNWRYVKKPTADIPATVKNFSDQLDDAFDQSSPSFFSCLTQNHYLAMGCNNQEHRGPSVFAMLLAYSGCSPEHAVDIADLLWGLNGIPYKTRLALAAHAYVQGTNHPASQMTMAQIFSAPPVQN